jgi:hypothetical protein
MNYPAASGGVAEFRMQNPEVRSQKKIQGILLLGISYEFLLLTPAFLYHQRSKQRLEPPICP